MTLRKLVKYLLPFGVVEIARNRREFQRMGLPLRPAQWLASERLLFEAEGAGLTLFPPGYPAQLRVVVDVGANIGQWASMLLHNVRPQRLIMIEPGPNAFRELERKYGRADFVKLHNIAVGDRAGTAKFHLTRDTTGASVLPPSEAMRAVIGSNWAVTEEIEVPMVTLDELLSDEQEIDLLKIDVQGLERETIAGAEATLARTKFVLIELNYARQYEGGSWWGDVHELLTGRGFVLVDAARPLRLNGRASMSDGLYINSALIPQWVTRDFV